MREILLADDRNPQVKAQIFCRRNVVLAGVDEAIAMLQLASHDAASLRIHALSDGDQAAPWETVLLIEGPLLAFGHLETTILGSLARSTRIATQARQAVDAAGGKDVLFFGARHDHYVNQQADGLAAHIGGVAGVSTDAQALHWQGQGMGTIPHALIAAYAGDTVAATRSFARVVDPALPVVALVDFDNDSAATSIAVAHELGERLHAVRLDTSASLLDRGLPTSNSGREHYGVSPALVRHVRNALDRAGFPDIQIVASGGFTAERISAYEANKVPVDGYGVGSSILHNAGDFDFTCDIVEVDGEPCAKVGRSYKANDRLQPAG
jgi:nicotinate phosphoribosyltransferase